MPRYFLDLTNSPSHTDDRGQMFDSLDDARAEAIRYTGELLRSETETLAGGHDLRVDVADETGKVLFSVCVRTFGEPDVRTFREPERERMS